MPTLALIIKEIRFRKLNFALSLLGVVVAAGLFVFFFTAGEASRTETARLMRNLGLNLRILPRETDMGRFWVTGFSERTMPEDYVRKLASQPGLSFVHLLPTLKQKVTWEGREVILVGIAPEVSPVDQKKASMSFALERGTVFLGHSLGGLAPGGDAKQVSGELRKSSEIELLGRRFAVARRLPESGTDQDVSIFGHLADVQAVLGLEGKINEIQALDCVCLDPTKDSLQVLRADLAKALPEAQVIQIRPLAGAREKQRQMIEDYLAVVLPLVVVAAAAWVGLLAMINVRERWREIGILRALGHGSSRIAALFLGRALIVGGLGALIGFTAGTAVALAYGPGVFKVTADKIQPLWQLLAWALAAAPALAAVAAFLPTVVAVGEDPAVALREQ